ncbi:MAG: WXG100 family type VII secretion target [Actinobacteria bacterium]|nr:MAG: WXG100 family type VII secretion target [Actinomycetota bacterium]
MNDELLVVNFGALQQASADIQKALNTLDSQLSQLEQDAAPLVATWSGEAKEAYEVRQARWRQASQDLQAMLRDIKVALDESAAEYLNTEKSNTALFQ